MNICRKRNKKVPLLLVWGGTFVLPSYEGLKVPALRLSFLYPTYQYIKYHACLINGIITFIPLGYLSSFNTTK